MHVSEFDFRYDWVAVTFDSLETGFKTIQKEGNSESWFDGPWQKEYAENILGVAFVVAQTYILGAVEDLNEVRESNSKNPVNKIDVYSDASQSLSNSVSSILLINSIANYYKHHDEWDIWPSNLTVEVLGKVGIGKDTEFPCCVVASA